MCNYDKNYYSIKVCISQLCVNQSYEIIDCLVNTVNNVDSQYTYKKKE